MSSIARDVNTPNVPSGDDKRSPQQLRRDRITAALVLLGFAIVMGVVIWLASQGGSTTDPWDDMWWMGP